MQVGRFWYDIEYNPPSVDKISLPAQPMAGFPLLPAVQLHSADSGACQWRWLRRRPSTSTTGQHAGAVQDVWEETGCRDILYTPVEEDCGCWLRVECRPGRFLDTGVGLDSSDSAATPAAKTAPQGRLQLGELATADVGPVQQAPAATAARLRAAAAVKPTAASSGAPLRVMTYNILADQYAGSEYAKSVLFNYCPLRQLESDYRRQLVLEELLTYQADVICLQVSQAAAHTGHSQGV